MDGTVACMERKSDLCKILIDESKRKEPPGRRSLRFEDNFKIDLKLIGCKDVGLTSRFRYSTNYALGNLTFSPYIVTCIHPLIRYVTLLE
jgi:hypothetical protein